MFTDVKTAAWILEAEAGEGEYIYVCSKAIPTETEIGVVARTVLEKYGHVPMRILSPEEIIALQLEVGQQWVVERRDKSSGLPLSNNKRGDVVNYSVSHMTLHQRGR
jgi:hypothetical protein